MDKIVNVQKQTVPRTREDGIKFTDGDVFGAVIKDCTGGTNYFPFFCIIRFFLQIKTTVTCMDWNTCQKFSIRHFYSETKACLHVRH